MDVILAPTSNRRTECVLSFKKVNGFLLIKLNIAPPPSSPPSSYAFLPCFSAFAISVSCTPPKITQVDEPISVKKKKKKQKKVEVIKSQRIGVCTRNLGFSVFPAVLHLGSISHCHSFPLAVSLHVRRHGTAFSLSRFHINDVRLLLGSLATSVFLGKVSVQNFSSFLINRVICFLTV